MYGLLLGERKSLHQKEEIMDPIDREKLIESIGERAREYDMKYAG